MIRILKVNELQHRSRMDRWNCSGSRYTIHNLTWLSQHQMFVVEPWDMNGRFNRSRRTPPPTLPGTRLRLDVPFHNAKMLSILRKARLKDKEMRILMLFVSLS